MISIKFRLLTRLVYVGSIPWHIPRSIAMRWHTLAIGTVLKTIIILYTKSAALSYAVKRTLCWRLHPWLEPCRCNGAMASPCVHSVMQTRRPDSASMSYSYILYLISSGLPGVDSLHVWYMVQYCPLLLLLDHVQLRGRILQGYRF